MQQEKRGSTWAFVSYVATSIIGAIGIPLALKDGRHLEAVFWGAILLNSVVGMIKYRPSGHS